MKKLHTKQKKRQMQKALAGSLTAHQPREHRGAYDTSHHLVEKKVTPLVFDAFVKELNSGRHQDIVTEAQKAATFEDSIGTIAACLSIVLDGKYLPEELFDVLLKALQRRVPGPVQSHHLDTRLQPTEFMEMDDSQVLHDTHTLEERADMLGVLGTRKVTNDEGPYTICRGCITSFDCISNRTCGLGTPATQLGNTVKTLETLRLSLSKRH